MAMYLVEEDEETCVSHPTVHVPVEKPGRDIAITVPDSHNNWYELTTNRIPG